MKRLILRLGFLYGLLHGGTQITRVFSALLTIFSLLLVLPSGPHAQQAEAPVYKDGDWWRVKVEGKRPPGVSVEGPQLGGFPEYLVKVVGDAPRVYGVREGDVKEIESHVILSLVLGRPGWRGDLLQFPMRVGLSWSTQFPLQLPGLTRQETAQYEIQSWEKVKTPKGEFGAFKILMNIPERTGRVGRLPGRAITYYYSPQVEAIVYLREETSPGGEGAATTSTLVDFNVNE